MIELPVENRALSEHKDKSNIAQDYGLSEFAYSCGYRLRLKHSSFMQDTLDWIESRSAELLPGETSNILSLGCGNGLFDIALMNILQRQNKGYSFTGVDFSKTDLDQFGKSLSRQDHISSSNVTLKNQKFEGTTELGARFDFILMIHFLHSFDNVLPVIKNAIRHLDTDGKLLIVQQKKKGMSEIKDQFLDVLPNQKFQNTDQIKELLHNEEIVFSAHDLETCFDVSTMQEMSLDTLLLMSFCFCNDLSVLSHQQQNKIRNTFLSFADVREDGVPMIHESMEAIVCYKK